MSVTTPTLYLRSIQVSGSVYQLNTSTGAQSEATSASIPALTVTPVTRRLTPEAATTTNATIPVAPATFASIGWRDVNDIIPLGDTGTTLATTIDVTLRARTNAGTASNYTFTVILYAGEVEIGRGSLAGGLSTFSTTYATYTVPVAIAAGTAVAANARLTAEIYIAAANAGISAIAIIVATNQAETSIAPVAFTVTAARNIGSASGPPSDAAIRLAAATRTAGDAAGAHNVTARRVVDYARRMDDAVPVPAAATSRQAMTNRQPGDTSTITDAAQRTASNTRRQNEALPASLDQAARAGSHGRLPLALAAALTDRADSSETYPRQGADAATAPTDLAVRWYLAQRQPGQAGATASAQAQRLVDTERGATETVADPDATALKLVTFGRGVRYQAQAGDEPLVDPTRAIEGVVRNSEGALHLGGALVVLFRSDTNVGVQTVMASQVDGSYRFPRNSYDTYRYFVAAWSTDGTRLQAVTERALTAV